MTPTSGQDKDGVPFLEVKITRSSVGDGWPLTVPWAMLRCRMSAILTVEADGMELALNGFAARKGYPSAHAILARGSGATLRRGLAELYEIASDQLGLIRADDCERREMVYWANELGIIAVVLRDAKQSGVSDPLVVLETADALPWMPFSRGANNSVGSNDDRTWFTAVFYSYEQLLDSSGAWGLREPLERLRAKGRTSVIAVNATGVFLASVS